MNPETILKILWELKTEDKFYFIKYGTALLSPNGIDIKIDHVERTILKGTLITHKQLKSKSQEPRFTRPRFLIWYLMRKIYKTTYADLGTYYNRDKLTARYGFETVKDLIQVDKKLAKKVENLELLIKES
jgi:chromosomal replication initiation ATPase DnaA